MAKDADEIKARVQRVIPELNNTSNTAIWSRMADVVGHVNDVTLLEGNRTQIRVENAARNLRTTNKQYYIEIALAFQFGDDLVIIDEETQREGYAVVDPTKQIIKQVSVSTPSPAYIKMTVATTDANGNLIPLTAEQLTDFRGYLARMTTAGIIVTTTSSPADVFMTDKLYVTYRSDYSLTNIQTALRTTLQNFQLILNTDSPLYVNDIENALREIPGIRDAYFDNPRVTYTDIMGVLQTEYAVDGVIPLNAGYFNFDANIYDFTKNITQFEPVQ